MKSLPTSWSSLSWEQLQSCWRVKQRYGGNPDVARAAALLALLGLDHRVRREGTSPVTGESLYVLCGRGGSVTVTPREVAAVAEKTIRWFDFPYGDPGEDAVKNDKGHVVKESREPVRGYVSPMRDALIMPEESVKVGRHRFALPQAACNNLTWQQYRYLQAVAPQLWQQGLSDEDVATLQAQFLAHILTPRSLALLDTTGGSIRLRPHWEYRYDAEQAEGFAKAFARRMDKLSTLFHICLQAYQTALAYYAASFPLLFQDNGKGDPLKDALTGEVGTINTIMKYAGYAEQQQVYDSALPYVLDILNTMTKEAKEIERMNARVRRK